MGLAATASDAELAQRQAERKRQEEERKRKEEGERQRKAEEERKRTAAEEERKRKEEAAHDAWVQMEEDLRRSRLQTKAAELEHEREMVSKSIIANAAHHAELDRTTTNWRMANNTEDMRHAHTMDTIMSKRYLTPSMVSAKPVEAVRAGFERTASSMKGTHMHKATAEGRAAVSSLWLAAPAASSVTSLLS